METKPKQYRTKTTEVDRVNRSVQSKSLTLILLLAFFAIIPTFLASPVAAASTIYVSTTGSDSSGDGTIAKPYATITRGVSAASAGDTVLVAQGTYHEMVNITKKITLQALGSDPSTTVIDASGLSMGIFVLGSSAAGTTIMGFTVANANNHGIYAQDTSNVVIENNVVTRNGVNPTSAFSGEDKAINLVGTSYSVIAGNTVLANYYGGIAVNDNGPVNPGFYSPGTLNPAVGNVVSGNTVVGNRPRHCSIVVSAYDAGAGVINNVVTNNIVVDNSAGIVVAANVANSQSINNTVAFNTILNNGEAGVIVHANAAGAVTSGTLIMGNTIGGNGVPANITISGVVMIAKYTGVLVGGESTAVAAQKTTVSANVLHNQYYGIYVVNGTKSTVLGNTFDSTVTKAIGGASLSVDPVATQLNSISASVSSLQATLGQLQSSSAKSSDLTALSNTVGSLSAALTQLQSSAAKQSDLANLSNNVATTSYVSYAALIVAILVGGLVLALSRRPRSK